MQRIRAIPVAWLGPGSCPNWPKGWILIKIIYIYISPGKTPVSAMYETGCAARPVWTSAENLVLPGIRSPDRPGCSKSTYRLSYPSPYKTYIHFLVLLRPAILCAPRKNLILTKVQYKMQGVCVCVCVWCYVLCYKFPEISHTNASHIRFLGRLLTYPFCFKLTSKGCMI
jgi:hypothetical protein